MGLLSILRKLKQKEKEMRILILGLDNAGKTTVVKKLSNGDTSAVSPTLGFEIQTFEYNSFSINLWDVGGQECIRAYWRNYFELTEGLVWVVDSTDPVRLELCRHELHALLQEEKLAGATLVVLANKCDIAGALSKEEIVKVLDLDRIISRHYSVYSTSATTGEGLACAFTWLVNDIASRVLVLA